MNNTIDRSLANLYDNIPTKIIATVTYILLQTTQNMNRHNKWTNRSSQENIILDSVIVKKGVAE